ncbi:hypothetical protein [Aliiroseovarius crassostreae]|uniref:hypothetical protein n=1 Tax=Aliiroseovarius crassostreae TaxID=154981 RepID=UPI00220A8DA6|nr:hypothetical protein [Aliiroseovarius crassostreae]UWP97682.1 hypothetical protein K3X53_09815 [Aliiroseovarius crassostreae]
MKLSDFRDPSGLPIENIEHLRRLAESEVDCQSEIITLAASSLLAGVEEMKEFSFSEATTRVGLASSQYLVHEAETDRGSQLIGYFGPSENRLPTTIEVIAAQYLLSEDGHSLAPDTTVLFSSKGFRDHSHFDIYQASLMSANGSFFQEQSQSIALEGSLSQSGSFQRAARYYGQSLSNRKEKYGALELYRALESGFLSMILAQVTNQFHIDAKRSLKAALDALEKERLQLASACQVLNILEPATKVARAINSSGPRGNKLAEELKQAFDKDTSPKPHGVEHIEWQGIWYIYQIRCSIAHAGAKGIVFEDFGADGDELLQEIYLHLEQMVLGALGITY